MADIIERRYKTTLRYAADLRTALEGVVKVYESTDNIEAVMRELVEAMHYAQEILKQMCHYEEVHEQIREISNE